MRWIRLIIGELLLLFASILVFRSAWTMLDEYLGKSNFWLMLALGIILTVAALILLDYEVKCELEKKKQAQRDSSNRKCLRFVCSISNPVIMKKLG